MARKKDERNLRKFTFNISEENYAYLEKICENSCTNLKVGTLLDSILTTIRENHHDVPLNAVRNKSIALLENSIEKKKALLKEAEEMLNKLRDFE